MIHVLIANVEQVCIVSIIPHLAWFHPPRIVLKVTGSSLVLLFFDTCFTILSPLILIFSIFFLLLLSLISLIDVLVSSWTPHLLTSSSPSNHFLPFLEPCPSFRFVWVCVQPIPSLKHPLGEGGFHVLILTSASPAGPAHPRQEHSISRHDKWQGRKWTRAGSHDLD